MNRRSTTRSSTLTGRALRRVASVVVAASAGALVTVLVLSATTGPSATIQDSGAPDRAERPSRALVRDTATTPALTDRLLPAAALATPTSGLSWSELRTEPHEPRSLAASCHRFPLVSVGALQVAHRAYAVGTSRATAEHVVARFADQRTAWRAHEVLLAWQADCGRTLADRVGVRLSTPHELAGALRYAVTWSPSDAHSRVREDVALLLVRSRVTLVRVTTAPADPGVGLPTVIGMAAGASQLLDQPGPARTR